MELLFKKKIQKNINKKKKKKLKNKFDKLKKNSVIYVFLKKNAKRKKDI